MARKRKQEAGARRASAQVVAPLLASAAVALLSGCHDTEMQRCVDANNRVVDPSFCKNLPAETGRGVVSGGGGGGFFPYGGYHYYYGGLGNYEAGTLATGGSNTPVSGHTYSSSRGTTRGGFGSSFGGGEGGEGGGHGGGAGE